MNRNNIAGLILAAAVLGLASFFAWSIFEIAPDVSQVAPSREAMANEYLALDRWLSTMGINIKTANTGSLSTIINSSENKIFIQTSLFDWDTELVPTELVPRDAAGYLARWVSEGGHLFLAIDNNFWDYDDIVLQLLENYGIAIADYQNIDDYIAERVPDYNQSWSYDPKIPSFSSDISFIINDDNLSSDFWALKDQAGIIRLVRVESGKGSFSVSGPPLFLYSQHLGDEPNSRLAWALFAREPAQNESVLFIRGKARARGFLGSLWKQGNLAVLLASVLAFAAIGFWAAIPTFGLVRSGDEMPGRNLKTMRERFLAEGRFLKKHHALGLYIDAYLKEIRRQQTRKGQDCASAKTAGIYSENLYLDRIIDNRNLFRRNLFRRNLFRRNLFRKHIPGRDFENLIITLKTTLEQLKNN